MTKRVPISKCVKCAHYRFERCPLEDLDPCNFTPSPEAMNEKFRIRYLAFVTAFGIAVIIFTIIFYHT